MFRNKDYILAIMREGSFSKAAQKLYISQPSLSASVRRIEDRISAPIFNRTSPISLTETGRKYVRYALEIEEKERDFARYVQDNLNFLTGVVKIGGSSFFSSLILPHMISSFSKKYPNIHFEITESTTKKLISLLNSGMLDIVLDNADINDNNISRNVYIPEMMLLAVPDSFAVNEKLNRFRLTAADIKMDNHLNDKYVTDIAPFAALPFILLNPDNDTGMRANYIFKKHNINPPVIFTLDQQITSYNISCTGMGVSFVSDTLVKRIDSDPSLYFYRLSDAEIHRNICFYNKNNHYLSVACRKFIDFNTEN